MKAPSRNPSLEQTYGGFLQFPVTRIEAGGTVQLRAETRLPIRGEEIWVLEPGHGGMSFAVTSIRIDEREYFLGEAPGAVPGAALAEGYKALMPTAHRFVEITVMNVCAVDILVSAAIGGTCVGSHYAS